MKGIGILLGEAGDLMIEIQKDEKGMILSGLVIGDATHQNQKALIEEHLGSIKHSPLTGVGIENYLDDDSPDSLLRAIRRQLVADGQSVKHLSIDNNYELKIEANYD